MTKTPLLALVLGTLIGCGSVTAGDQNDLTESRDASLEAAPAETLKTCHYVLSTQGGPGCADPSLSCSVIPTEQSPGAVWGCMGVRNNLYQCIPTPVCDP